MEEYVQNVEERFPTVGFQDVNVCMPVTVKACGEVGKVRTQCVGRPVIEPGCDKCPGECNESCTFTITQKIRVRIPITLGAKAEAGEASISFDDADTEGNCTPCDC